MVANQILRGSLWLGIFLVLNGNRLAGQEKNLNIEAKHGIVKLSLASDAEAYSEEDEQVLTHALSTDIDAWLVAVTQQIKLTYLQQEQLELSARMEARRLVRACESEIVRPIRNGMQVDAEVASDLQQRAQFMCTRTDTLLARVFGEQIANQQLEQLSSLQVDKVLSQLSLFEKASPSMQVFLVESLLKRSVSGNYDQFAPLTDQQREAISNAVLLQLREQGKNHFIQLADFRSVQKIVKQIDCTRLGPGFSNEQLLVLEAVQTRM